MFSLVAEAEVQLEAFILQYEEAMMYMAYNISMLACHMWKTGQCVVMAYSGI